VPRTKAEYTAKAMILLTFMAETACERPKERDRGLIQVWQKSWGGSVEQHIYIGKPG
jgi:hypothetical protein